MATATLLCKQCNFENEPERVYCHNCGAKLDRALLPPEATKREDPQTTQARVRSVVQPSRFAAWPLFKNLVISVLVAAVLAALVVICRPPADQPALSQDVVMTAPAISDDLEDLLQSPGPKRLTYTETQVNGFLQGSLRPKEESSFGIPLKYERTFVRFREGRCHATLQESIFGYSFYLSSTDGVEIRNGQVVTQPVEGSLGRLRIPAKAMPTFEKMFASMWSPLAPYKKMVGRLGSIAFHQENVVVAAKSGNVP